MRRPDLAEMTAFIAVAERASFAKAALQLGLSRSALSETISGLEARLGVRLLNRTTRSVSLTEIGERLLTELRPALDSVEAALDGVNRFRDKPAGMLRLTVPRPAARVVIEPILARFILAYPGITLEIVTDSGLTDIVRDRFDAGIRPGHRVEQDMVALRIGEDSRPTVVAAPDYLSRHGTPAEPDDLRAHNCLRLRFASGALHQWVFEREGRRLEVVVTGSLIVTDGDLAVRAAIDGAGLARVPISSVARPIADGRLVPLLQDWAPPSVGFYLYYSSRQRVPAPLQAFIEFVKAERRKVGESG
jgi:DNA-binding transcriptional LysR family regulator